MCPENPSSCVRTTQALCTHEYPSNISVNVNRGPFLPGVTGMVAENKPNTQPEET